MKRILILSGIPFNFTKQRPHHIAKYFATKGYQVIYLGLNDTTSFIKHNDFNMLSFNEVLKRYSRKYNNVYVLNNIFIEETEETKTLDLSHVINKICNSINNDDLTIIVEHPYWINSLLEISPKIKLIYDCLDDWEGFVNDLDYGMPESLLHNEKKLASISDLVLVSAKRLYGKMSVYNDNVYYLPNGVWNQDYSKVLLKNDISTELDDISGPIIFFMGGIAGWVDIDLIEFISKNRPEYSFVFVGDEVKVKLPNRGNIYHLGKKKYSELPYYLKKATVAIIPFKETNLTASVTPLKYYEYMSAGVPVVSTMLPDLVNLKGSKIVRNYDEFINAIDYFVNLNEDEYKEASEQAILTSKDFDWNKLLEPLTDYIEKNGKFTIPDKNLFINQTIQKYEKFSDNDVVKNELISFYNLKGEYKKTTKLYKFHELLHGELEIDYNQMALAYFMLGDREKSIELLKFYFKKQKELICNSKYVHTVKSLDNTFYKSYLYKICGRQFEALQFLDDIELTPKFSGLITSLYFDIGEYEIGMHYASNTLSYLDEYGIDELLDPYCIIDIIDYLISNNKLDIAEQLSMILMGRGKILEQSAVEKLGEIYFIKNLPD